MTRVLLVHTRGGIVDEPAPISAYQDSEPSMQNVFDEMVLEAGEVDAHGSLFDRLVLQVAPLSGRVLDVGCGTGRLSRRLADRGLTVIGIDSASEVIRIARERSRASKTLSFQEASIEELQTRFSGCQFDLICAMRTLHHLDTDSIRQFLQACRSSLVAPGGKLVLVDICSRRSRLVELVANPRRLALWLSGALAALRILGARAICDVSNWQHGRRRVLKSSAWRRHIHGERIPDFNEWKLLVSELPGYSAFRVSPRQFMAIWSNIGR